MNASEREIIYAYGGWTGFCHSMSLKPFVLEDSIEAYRIVQAMAEEQRRLCGAHGLQK